MKQIAQPVALNIYPFSSLPLNLARSLESHSTDQPDAEKSINTPDSPEITGIPDDPELERAPVNIDDPADTSPETKNPLSGSTEQEKNHKTTKSALVKKYGKKPSAAERALIKYMHTSMDTYVCPARRMLDYEKPDMVSNSHW